MLEFLFGVYHYSYVTSLETAELEAKNCLKFIGNKKLDLPVFLDLEEKKSAALGKDLLTKCAIRFCEIIEEAGYKAGVYANLNWFTNYVNPYKIIEKGFKIWLAQWNTKPTANFKIDYWQYTSKGQIHGIQGNVDLDISYDDINNTQTVDNSVEKPIGYNYEVGKTYKTTVDLRVREGAGTNYRIKTYKELTFNAKLHAYKQLHAVLKPKTKVTCLEIKKVENDIWLRIPSRLDSRIL